MMITANETNKDNKQGKLVCIVELFTEVEILLIRFNSSYYRLEKKRKNSSKYVKELTGKKFYYDDPINYVLMGRCKEQPEFIEGIIHFLLDDKEIARHKFKEALLKDGRFLFNYKTGYLNHGVRKEKSQTRKWERVNMEIRGDAPEDSDMEGYNEDNQRGTDHKSLQDPGGEVSVFYATNRKRTGSTEPDKKYGGEMAEVYETGVCNISIPADHKRGALERPRKLLLWNLRDQTTEKDIVLTEVRDILNEVFFRWVYGRITNTEKKSALIFVHGYNTSFAEAAWRTGQLAYDMPFNGLTGFFSWPSSAKKLDYLGDIERADSSIPALEHFIGELINKGGVEELHFVAHSMGNRILTNALKNILMSNRLGPKLKAISQIVLAAPDIDQDVFENNIYPYFKNIGKSRTLYASDKDKALQISKTIRGNRIRLGDSGRNIFLAPGLDSIDASNVKSSGTQHSYLFEANEVLADLYYLIEKGFDPLSRRLLRLTRMGRFTGAWAFPR